jgi:hypothetical protein
MAFASEHFMDQNRLKMRERLQQFFARTYPGTGGNKRLALDVDCDPRAARNYLAGCWPPAEIVQSLVRMHGHAAVDALFGPELEAKTREIINETERVRRRQVEHKARVAALHARAAVVDAVGPRVGH